MSHKRITSHGVQSSDSAQMQRTLGNFKIGDQCEALNKKGIIKYYGETSFSSGKWVGIELEEPEGKNNGEVRFKN